MPFYVAEMALYVTRMQVGISPVTAGMVFHPDDKTVVLSVFGGCFRYPFAVYDAAVMSLHPMFHTPYTISSVSFLHAFTPF